MRGSVVGAMDVVPMGTSPQVLQEPPTPSSETMNGLETGQLSEDLHMNWSNWGGRQGPCRDQFPG